MAGLPAGWRGARPYVGVYEPWKLRVSWTLAWLLVLAELGFFLAEWLTLTTRETAGECAQTMLVAFFVAPLSGIAARAVLMFGLTALTSLVFARRAARLERRGRACSSPPPASLPRGGGGDQAQDEPEQQLGDPEEPQAAHHLALQSDLEAGARERAGAFSPRRSKASKADSSAASDEASAELSRRVRYRRRHRRQRRRRRRPATARGGRR